MTPRSKSTATLQPVNPDRGNPNYTRMVCQQDWREGLAPAQEPRHPEQKRNELFLCNVTRSEFAWLSSKSVNKGDFKAFRIGTAVAGATGATMQQPLYPMFGALKKGARIRRKEAKLSKRKRKTNEQTNEKTD